MNRVKLVMALIFAAFAFGVLVGQERAKREPMTFVLDCAGGDCPLLKGAPQTSGMRGGSVKLKPGESVGWHSTSANARDFKEFMRISGMTHVRTSPYYPQSNVSVRANTRLTA